MMLISVGERTDKDTVQHETSGHLKEVLLMLCLKYFTGGSDEEPKIEQSKKSDEVSVKS